MTGHVENPLALHAMACAIGVVAEAVADRQRPTGPLFISLLDDISMIHQQGNVIPCCLPIFIELKRFGRFCYADSCVSCSDLAAFQLLTDGEPPEDLKRLASFCAALSSFVVGNELDRRLAHGIADDAGVVVLDAPALFDVIEADVDYILLSIDKGQRRSVNLSVTVDRLIDLDAVSVTVLDPPDHTRAKLRVLIGGTPVRLVAPDDPHGNDSTTVAPAAGQPIMECIR